MDKLKNKLSAKTKNLHDSQIGSENNAVLIALLMDAEKKASNIIESAKRRKAAALKKAREDSEQELGQYKKNLENEFQYKQKEFQNSKGQGQAQVERELEVKQANLNKAFKDSSNTTLDHVLNIVINVGAQVHKNYRKN